MLKLPGVELTAHLGLRVGTAEVRLTPENGCALGHGAAAQREPARGDRGSRGAAISGRAPSPKGTPPNMRILYPPVRALIGARPVDIKHRLSNADGWLFQGKAVKAGSTPSERIKQ